MEVKVYPTSEASLNIRHPNGSALNAKGSNWPLDGFTARMITDKAITRDEPATAPAPAVTTAPPVSTDAAASAAAAVTAAASLASKT